MKTHPCPGHCKRDVPNRLFACWDCWHRLPEQIRQPMLDTLWFDPEEHTRAVAEAQQWFHVAANNEAFGTTCIDCGRGIGDEDETMPDEDGNLLHVGCGDPDAVPDRNEQIIELAHKLRQDDEAEALMAGSPVILPHLSEYLERAAALLGASE